MPWHDQRACLEYMEQAEDIPLSFSDGDGGLPSELAPQQRTVESDAQVIDLRLMMSDLTAERDRLRGGG